MFGSRKAPDALKTETPSTIYISIISDEFPTRKKIETLGHHFKEEMKALAELFAELKQKREVSEEEQKKYDFEYKALEKKYIECASLGMKLQKNVVSKVTQFKDGKITQKEVDEVKEKMAAIKSKIAEDFPTDTKELSGKEAQDCWSTVKEYEHFKQRLHLPNAQNPLFASEILATQLRALAEENEYQERKLQQKIDRLKEECDQATKKGKETALYLEAEAVKKRSLKLKNGPDAEYKQSLQDELAARNRYLESDDGKRELETKNRLRSAESERSVLSTKKNECRKALEEFETAIGKMKSANENKEKKSETNIAQERLVAKNDLLRHCSRALGYVATELGGTQMELKSKKAQQLWTQAEAKTRVGESLMDVLTEGDRALKIREDALSVKVNRDRKNGMLQEKLDLIRQARMKIAQCVSEIGTSSPNPEEKNKKIMGLFKSLQNIMKYMDEKLPKTGIKRFFARLLGSGRSTSTSYCILKNIHDSLEKVIKARPALQEQFAHTQEKSQDKQRKRAG